MTTSTNSLNLTVSFDATADKYSWEVIDADGDVVDVFATKREATAAAKELNDDAEKAEIIETIDLDDLDLETLRKIRALIG
jgi:hypothetical protein